MATDLKRIREKASKNRNEVFTSLWHHVCDVDHLRVCYETLDGKKAVGIDGVDKKVYGENLESNLKELSAKLQRLGYRPQAKRRHYIPKAGSEKGRPLAISNFEDKIVEKAIKVVLEQIYEEDFEDSSYGYRPGRTPHQCLDDLGRTIQQKRVSYVVEADIRSFFDKVNHDWLMKFLGHRIGDKRLLRMIERMLKAGILEDGLVQTSEEGTPQGSILSPLLSNIYLHYVLDLWFNKRVAPKWCKGGAYLFRYADDFVACFDVSWRSPRVHELAEGQVRAIRTSLGRGKDEVPGIRAICPRKCEEARREARRVHLPGVRPLLWKDQGGLLQGQTPNQSQETGSESEEVHRVVQKESLLDDQRADVASGESPNRRLS